MFGSSDVNECALGLDDCRVGERCENTNGGFSCRRIRHCGTGYTLDEVTQTCVGELPVWMSHL